ncbi:hypothetical protein G3R49_09255 [Shewanella sp. WXL01]|uniref:hypothetical protein n=1 Tax=Shewanella sp. WXL01 TaxID=2709721 RepID=UPI0014383405|nr:hypothetical protein [Shewanella sp. WXL01]NKF50756.1 hypothetical protein [Shewanella sp. WXL01]
MSSYSKANSIDSAQHTRQAESKHNDYSPQTKPLKQAHEQALELSTQSSPSLDQQAQQLFKQDQQLTNEQLSLEQLSPEQVARLEVIEQRRDHIVLLAMKGKKFSDMPLLTALANKYHCSVLDIMDDLELLTQPAVWKQHKSRLKSTQELQIMRKQQLQKERKNTVGEFMDESVKFNSDLLIALSKQFECKPKQIVADIMHYKSYDNLISGYKQAKASLPGVRAALRCAKLNLKY